MLLTRARAGTGVRGGIPTPPSPREADLGHPLAALARQHALHQGLLEGPCSPTSRLPSPAISRNLCAMCVLAAVRGSGAWLRRGGREEAGGAQLTRMKRVGGGAGAGYI